MEFSLGRETLPSQARSVRGESRRLRRERDNAKKLLYRCLGRRIAQRDRAVAIMRPVFNATGEPPPTLSLFMIACQGTTQAENRTGTYRYRPRARAHARRGMYRGTCRGECRDDKRAIAAVSLRLPSALRLPSVCPLPPRSTAGRSGTDHFHGRTRSCLTSNTQQPQSRQHHSNQAITQMNMCDDVSVNMSLFGNERETPSIRSRIIFGADNAP